MSDCELCECVSVTGFVSRHVSEFGYVSAWLLVCVSVCVCASVCLSVCMSSVGVYVYECVTGFVCEWVCECVCERLLEFECLCVLCEGLSV